MEATPFQKLSRQRYVRPGRPVRLGRDVRVFACNTGFFCVGKEKIRGTTNKTYLTALFERQ